MLGFGKRNTYVFVRRQVRHRDDFVQTKFAFPHVPKLFRDSLHAVLIPIKESVSLVYRDGLVKQSPSSIQQCAWIWKMHYVP